MLQRLALRLMFLLMTALPHAVLPHEAGAQACGVPGYNAPAGCSCQASWTYNGKSYCGCSDPDNDPTGPWCYTNGVCNGQNYAYCVGSFAEVRTVEVAVIVDHSLFLAKGAGARAFVNDVFDYVHAIYAATELNLAVRVSGVIQFADADPWNVSAATPLDQYLGAVTTWADTSGNIRFHHDNVILLTNLDMSGTPTGLGWLGGVCSRYSVSVIEATAGVQTVAARVAHQLGHNLGAPHDATSNPCSSTGYLMGPINDTLADPSTVLSSCSIANIRSVFQSTQCLENNPGTCGDGFVGPNEACDDDDVDSDDGCSESCTVEPGWSCSGVPSECEPCGSMPFPNHVPGGGCTCAGNWSYNGQTFCGGACGNPDSDPNGPWCFTDAVCNGSNFVYCVSAQCPYDGATCVDGGVDGVCDDDVCVTASAPSATPTIAVPTATPTVQISDVPIAASKVKSKRAKSGAEKFVFSARDPAAPFPLPGGPSDPRLVGATLELYARNGETASFALPASGWELNRTATAYKFVNKTAPDAFSPVRSAAIKNTRKGTQLSVTSKRTGVSLATPQGGMGLRLSVGTLRTCARFDAANIKIDEADQFSAVDAVATAVSDCAPASLHGHP